MGYPAYELRFKQRTDREIAERAELARCASIMEAVGLELVSHRGDRDGHLVELRMGRRVTRGFGLTICEAFAAAAREHQR